MRRGVVENVVRMLSCGRNIRGITVYQCSNPDCQLRKHVPFTCKSRFCPSCGKKLTDQWVEQQKTVMPDCPWQHITFTMPDALWELFRYNRHLLNDLSRLSAEVILKVGKKQKVVVGIFTVLHTFGRSLIWNVHIHLSVTRGGITPDGQRWKPVYFSGASLMPQWRYAIIDLFRQAWDQGQLTLPDDLEAQCPDRAAFNRWLDRHYQKHWVVHFAQACANAERNIHYLGRYLKRPVISMSRLPKKDPDGKVDFSYLDHRTKRYRRFRCSEDDFLKRLLQHIPVKHFRMIRHYGFLANRVRSKYLPKVYNLLNQPERNALKIRWPGLMKSSFGIDPLCCPRCGAQLERLRILPGKSLARLLTIHDHWATRQAMVA